MRAQSALQTQDYAKAKFWAEKALKMDPENKSAKEVLEFLKQVEQSKKKK